MPTQKLPIVFLAFANEQEQGNAYLRSLPVEQRTLVRILEQAKDAGKCELVVKYNATIDDIFDTFQHERNQGRICVFHFGGHASSFQLLLESESGGNQSANAKPLIRFLSKQEGLRFVFLNACSTQGQVQQLMDAGIPSIATSKSINDEVATAFAVRFYKGLSKDLSLGKCYDEAAEHTETFHSSGNVRDLYWEEATDEDIDGMPWGIHVAGNREALLKWSLAQERISGDWVNRVRELIKKDKLKEALKLAEQNLEGDAKQDVIALQATLKRISRMERNGLLRLDEVGIEYAKITHSLLSILGDSTEE